MNIFLWGESRLKNEIHLFSNKKKYKYLKNKRKDISLIRRTKEKIQEIIDTYPRGSKFRVVDINTRNDKKEVFIKVK